MSTTPTYRKKLIEVALPLEAINREAAREKSIRHGHPSTLHLWWARRPLAACRAVLFASLVDDPDSEPAFDTYKSEDREHAVGTRRAELFELIEELVKWQNSNDPVIINAARAEIARSVASRLIEKGEIAKTDTLPGGTTMWDLVVRGAVNLARVQSGAQKLPNADDVNHFLANYAPPVLDPFCGGGSIPLEAQRLGLRAFASDLNPVPVLITKALIEIPPKFAGSPPVHPQGDEIDRQLQKARNKSKKRSVGQTDLLDRPWPGASGLAEDVRYYGKWMRDEAEKRIGHLYPKVKITAEMVRDRPDLKPYAGRELTVIAWLWARTVPSPNPALVGAHVPLVRSFWLSTKKSKQAWVEPVIARDGKSYRFTVRTSAPTAAEKKAIDAGTKTGRGCKFHCLLSDTPIPEEHIKIGARAGDMGTRLMAIVAEGERGRVYLSPTDDQEATAQKADPGDSIGAIHAPLANDPRNLWCLAYGLDHFDKLFTPRQLVALTTFSDLVMEARERVLADAQRAAADVWGAPAGDPRASAGGPGGLAADRLASATRSPASGTHPLGSAGRPLASATGPRTSPDGRGKRADAPLQGGSAPLPAANPPSSPADAVFPDVDTATAYADAVATYLAFAVSKSADYNCTLVTWINQRDQAGHAFSKQALPMVWDFVEVNPLVGAAGDPTVSLAGICKAFQAGSVDAFATVEQRDATLISPGRGSTVLCTDPPYYDNIGYADLSDFFYIWLRRSLGAFHTDLCRTVLTPKAEELIASPYRHDGDGEKAMRFFETGLGRAFERMREAEHADYPLTVFYAFKQAETDETDEDDGSSAGATSSTGWETMLEGLIASRFSINGTWPMRTERTMRSVGMNTNALASSIVLVCRPRAADAAMTTRKDFVAALKKELPAALRDLQSGNIAPVDLAQAAIGPGMAVYSRYAKVVNSDGSRMPVRTALQLINQTLDEVLSELESEFDSDTRWAIKWFEQHAHDEGAYGTAETLSTAMAVSVSGLKEAGLIKSGQGKVRLLRRDELLADWDPATDKRLTIWEVTQYLIRRLETDGEQGAAELLRQVGALGEVARDLAYRLYSTCERKKWAEEARSYNGLVVSWPEIGRLSRERRPEQVTTQAEMEFD